MRVARLVVRVRRVAADSREASTLGLLVDDHLQDVTHHEHAHLALGDARQQALVDELATRLLAALEVLAREGRLPRARLGSRAVHAELDELLDGVVLDVVVVHLHQLELVVVVEHGVPVVLAVVLALQPDEPDALTRRAAVLLDDARLEGRVLLEALGELIAVVVRHRVRQAAREGVDRDERVLGAHLGLHLGRGPHELALGELLVHQLVEALLCAWQRALRELAGVDAHDQRVELLDVLCELVMLRVEVLDDLALVARLDHTVRDRDRIDAVSVRPLVRAAVLCARDVELHDTQLELWLGRLRHERVVTAVGDGLREGARVARLLDE
mmetsp:Transcript_2472/g.6457  ORF Transcript_2472/g.6457 Transcript_2472/m.6457 type:complete len:328 (+) Transcript_2472:570-1553(+)